MDPNPKQQAVERIKDATNILVTVSKNPTVDQLSACIGFTLLLNKLGKHATAVFSGVIPSTLEFLQPEKTLEQNTDSLRDFIIALDKSKADKLRYKVEDEVVRIFITPYRTSITEKDLDFSQGDFNVDVVVALGVTNKEDIDNAIVTHGRILHDAVVISVTNGQSSSDVGSINWHDAMASSLSEMLVSVSESFQSGLLDSQMATAFLTGIVAETERFSNDKTSPKVMTMSAQLMAAGANQQLIAAKLAPAEPEPLPSAPAEPVAPYLPPGEQELPAPVAEEPKPDGEIDINHEPEPEPEKEPVDENEIHIDDQGNLKLQEEIRLAAEEAARKSREQEEKAQSDSMGEPAQPAADSSYLAGDSHKVISPINPDKYDPLAAFGPAPAPVTQEVAEPPMQLPPVADSASEPSVLQPVDSTPAPEPVSMPEMSTPELTAAASSPVMDSLAQLEQDVHSPHVGAVDGALDTPSVDDARQSVMTAAFDSAPRPQASQSLGAQNIDMNATAQPVMPTPPAMTAVGDVLQQTSVITPDQTSVPVDPMSPPPVPPPMMPQYFTPTTNNHGYLNSNDQPAQQDPNAQQL